MAKILIKNGRVFDGEEFFFADVLTDNEKILKIEPDISDGADFVFDASGKTVTAGLVDAHVHMKGISSDIFGISADMSTLPFGVTTAADCSGKLGDKALLDAFSVNSRVFVSVEIKNNRAVLNNVSERLKKYGDRVAGLKVYYDTKSSDVRDIKPLLEILAFAEKRGLIITLHSSNSPIPMSELLGALRRGDILTHAYHGGKNNVAEDGYECIKSAKARGVIIDAGLAGNVHTDFEIFKGAVKAGASPDIITTDITRLSAYKRGGKYGLPMCMSIAKEVGMDEKSVFRAVTSAPARALGTDNECGRMGVGGRADIAVLGVDSSGAFELTDNAENTVKADKGYANFLTLLSGEIVYKK